MFAVHGEFLPSHQKLRFAAPMERSQHWPFVMHHWQKKTFVSLSLCNFHCFWSQEPISAKWRRDDGSVVTWGDPSCGGDASAVGSRSESRFSDVQLLSKWKHWEHILWVYLVLWFLTPQLCRKCFLLDLFAGSEENQGVSAAWKWMVNMFSASPSSRAVSAALPWQDTKACFSDLQHIWCFCSDQSSHLETTASDFADIFVVMPVLLSFVSSFKLKCILWGRICCDMGGCRLGRGLFCSAKWALHGCICVWNFPSLPGTAQQWHFLSRWWRTLLATSTAWHVRTVVTWASALCLSFSM